MFMNRLCACPLFFLPFLACTYALFRKRGMSARSAAVGWNWRYSTVPDPSVRASSDEQDGNGRAMVRRRWRGPVSLVVMLALVGPSETGDARRRDNAPPLAPSWGASWSGRAEDRKHEANVRLCWSQPVALGAAAFATAPAQGGVALAKRGGNTCGLSAGGGFGRTHVLPRQPWKAATRLVCLAAKQQAEGADSIDPEERIFQDAVGQDGLMTGDMTEVTEDIFTDDVTIELSGEQLALRDPNEATADDEESGEGENYESVETGDSFLKEWGRLSPAEFERQVEELYPRGDDSSQADLLRARAEIARAELKTDEQRDAFDVDDEVEKLIAYQKQATLNAESRAAAAALRKTTGIPGEVVEGGPEYPKLADYERAHDLHEKLAKRPVLDIDKIAQTFPELLDVERFKEYVSAENVSLWMKAGRVSEERGLVAEGMERVVLDVMAAAVKLAQKERPGLTAAGGALHESTQVLGDLYPTMVVRLTFRQIQYALVAGEADWAHSEGLSLFAMLLREMNTEVEAVEHLLCAGVAAFANALQVPPESTRAMLQPHVDMLIGKLHAASAEVADVRAPTRGDFGNDWRQHWRELPLREIWDDPDSMDMNQYLQFIRAEAEEEDRLAAQSSKNLYGKLADASMAEEEATEEASAEEEEMQEDVSGDDDDEWAEDDYAGEDEEDEETAALAAEAERYEEEKRRASSRAAAERVHPFNDPRAWREWVESSAWEDFQGRPRKVEDIFRVMFEGMQAAGDQEWLRRAGITDDEGELITKVCRPRSRPLSYPSSIYARTVPCFVHTHAHLRRRTLTDSACPKCSWSGSFGPRKFSPPNMRRAVRLWRRARYRSRASMCGRSTFAQLHMRLRAQHAHKKLLVRHGACATARTCRGCVHFAETCQCARPF